MHYLRLFTFSLFVLAMPGATEVAWHDEPGFAKSPPAKAYAKVWERSSPFAVSPPDSYFFKTHLETERRLQKRHRRVHRGKDVAHT